MILTIVIECVVICALFTVIVVTAVRKRDPVDYIYDYPEEIIERAYKLNMIDSLNIVEDKNRILKKFIAGCLVTVLLTAIVIFVNHAETFEQGMYISYAIWAVVVIYDVILDCVWFCHDEKVRLPGTEDLADAYLDYGYHIRMGLHGLILGIPICLTIGLFIAII